MRSAAENSAQRYFQTRASTAGEQKMAALRLPFL
jgi:hypothetical protein